MQLIFLTLVGPSVAAERIAASPRWLATFLLLCAVSVGATALEHPHAVRRTLSHLPRSADASDREEVRHFLDSELPGRLWFTPVRLFAGWGSFSLMLFTVARSFQLKKTVRFRQVLSLVVHTETISVVAALVALATVMATRWDGLSFPPLSLAPLGETFLAQSFLRYVSVFVLWQIWIQIVAISILCGFGPRRSIVVVLVVWVLTMLFDVGVAQLLVDRFHLML